MAFNTIIDNRQGFGIRLGAVLIDFIVIIVLFMTLGGMIGGIFGLDTLKNSNVQAGMAGVGSIISLAYNFLEAMTGKTLGKIILSLEVVHLNGTKGNIQLFIKRYLIKNGGSLLMSTAPLLDFSFLNLIGGIWVLIFFIGCFAALGDKKLALHDIIAQTAIYKSSDIIIPEKEEEETR